MQLQSQLELDMKIVKLKVPKHQLSVKILKHFALVALCPEATVTEGHSGLLAQQQRFVLG